MDSETLKLIARVLNTAVLFVISYGLLVRRRPRVHIPVMLAAFAIDVANVFLVELVARASEGVGAVERAATGILGGSMTPLQYVHIATSFLCILGYVAAIITGRRLYRMGLGRAAHRANAVLFLATRLVSYATSFAM